MTRKRRKPASFDAMVKLFIRNYDIPTRKDVDMLMAKLDRLETLIKAGALSGVRLPTEYPGHHFRGMNEEDRPHRRHRNDR